MFQIQFCAKQQVWINNLSEERPKGHLCLLRFELNSAATSDGGAQKLGNDVRHDSESSATKFAAKLVANEMQCLQAM